MVTRPATARTHSGRVRLLGVATALITVSATLALGLSSGSDALASTGSAAPVRDNGTTFRISTFNVLGADHTANGQKKGYASGTTRMKWAYQLLTQHDIDVVGFQEFQRPQMNRFRKLAGSKWAIWPGDKLGTPSIANNIGWRTSVWSLVGHGHMKVPYFHGAMIAMPWVLLRNRETGRKIYVYNSHNPADVRGPAQKYRNEDVKLEIALVAKLRAKKPNVPVFITGDKNDRSNYFCPMATAGMQSSDGGSAKGGHCDEPAHASIDWILATPEVRFRGYTSIRNALVAKTTDHHFVYSDAFVPSTVSMLSAIRHVVVISIDGLNAKTVRSGKQTPTLATMARTGVSTLAARTDRDTVNESSNNLSMMTGLRAFKKYGGHGFTRAAQRGAATVNATAHRYLSSDFGVTHDFGYRTALVGSNPKLSIIRTSWNKQNGVPDPYEPGNGTDKIDWYSQTKSDAQTASAASALFTHTSMRYMFVEFSSVLAAARAHGPNSSQYASAVRTVDGYVKKIFNSIAAQRWFNNRTAVIVTASRGWTNKTSKAASRPNNFTVPLLITGPGVPAGADLYHLNPGFKRPDWRKNPGYKAAAQPIRTGDLANLATRLLGEPAIPGSGIDTEQMLTIGVG